MTIKNVVTFVIYFAFGILLGAKLGNKAEGSDIKDFNSKVDTVLNCDSIIIKDYEAVKALTDKPVTFFENKIEFDRLITSDTTPSVVRTMSIMATKDTVWTVVHTVGAESTLTKQYGHWMEDVAIDVYATKVGLDSAFVCLAKADCKKPESRVCTFRKPLYKEIYKDAFWVFGSPLNSVSVDCGTGAVKPLPAPEYGRLSLVD